MTVVDHAVGLPEGGRIEGGSRTAECERVPFAEAIVCLDRWSQRLSEVSLSAEISRTLHWLLCGCELPADDPCRTGSVRRRRARLRLVDGGWSLSFSRNTTKSQPGSVRAC